MTEHLQLVQNDLHNISLRIKQIDPDYFLVFNLKTNKYEVHNTKNKPNTLAIVCPYEQLDARLYNLVKKTQSQFASNIITEIETTNLKIEKQEQENKLDTAKQQAKYLLQKFKK